MLGALVADEDNDGVDVHVVQPLDGVGADVQQAMPVLGDSGMSPGPGLGTAPSRGPRPPFSATDGPHLPHTAAREPGSVTIFCEDNTQQTGES